MGIQDSSVRPRDLENGECLIELTPKRGRQPSERTESFR